jgi:hypothetical protein
MRKLAILSSVLVFALGISTQTFGSLLYLQPGDVVTYLGPTANQHVGNGGAFDWQIKSVVPSPASSPVGTQFQTFCTELQQSISLTSPGPDYTIKGTFIPTTSGAMNTSGNVLADMKGIYLLDLWSNGAIVKNQSDAGAVQYAIWKSEGYSDQDIKSLGGYSTSDFNSAVSQSAWLLGHYTLNGVAYSSSWTPADIVAFTITSTKNGSSAQDQIVLGYTSNGNNSVVPEPVSFAVWGIGSGLAAAGMAVRRRKQPQGRWSDKNRRAIMEIVNAKR